MNLSRHATKAFLMLGVDRKFCQEKIHWCNNTNINVMAEQGLFDSKKENDRFKSAQRKFVNSRQNACLVYAKGSSHNIPQDKSELVIREIAKFYRKYLNQYLAY